LFSGHTLSQITFLFIMHKLAIYTFIFGALSLSACTQSSPTQAAQVSANSKDIFNGEVWLRPGKRVRYRRGGTIYLGEASPKEFPPNAYSLPTLRRMFGAEKAERTGGHKKVYYIAE
jgi:hypothetical protein